MEKDKTYYQEFTKKVYELFNGQINPTHPATQLIIADNDPDLAGFSAEGKIYIFVENIMRVNKFYRNVETCIMVFIVHELLHLENPIDQKRYDEDVEYNYMTEYQVDFDTCLLLLTNINFIESEIFADVDKERIIEFLTGVIVSGRINNYDAELYKDIKYPDIVPDKIKETSLFKNIMEIYSKY